MRHVTGQAGGLLLAACFTFSCAAIYEMRARTQALAGILIRAALCLGPVVVVVALPRGPAGPLPRPGAATAGAASPGRPVDRWLPAPQRPRATGMLRSATPDPPSSAAGGAASGPVP